MGEARAQLRTSWLFFASAFVAPGCGDDPPPAASGDTDVGISGTGTDTGDTGDVLPDDDSEDTNDPDTTGDGPGVCETVLCGPKGDCCEDGQECAGATCQPACETGVRCGAAQDMCCAAGQVCLAAECVDPTGACLDSFDCDFGEFCEPTIGQCLPQSDPVICEILPDFEEIAVLEEWAWTTDQVVSIPVVADLDGDGMPEVIVNTTHQDGGSWPDGEIVALAGNSGAELWRIDHDPANGGAGSFGRASVAVADVDGDSLPDVLYAGRGSSALIHAVDGQGNELWVSHDPDGTPHTFPIANAGISIANLDDDPMAELVIGVAVIDHDGTVVWSQAGDTYFGSDPSYAGGITAIADLDMNGTPELITGQHAWNLDWVDVGGVPNVTVTERWDAGGNDGYPAIADLDGDGDPEVIVVASGQVRVLDGQTGQAWCGVDPTDAMCIADPLLRTAAVDIPGGGLGGPPTVADFDGDGRPEIAAAGGSSYSVYDLNRADEEVVVPIGEPAPAAGAVYVRWSSETQDQSSNATGSSVFDFQGDGIAEVVYQDECYMRVYSGVDGTILVQEPNSSGTIHEYPLVVDVDADGNSEILVVANDGHSNCDALPGYTYRRGVRVLGDQFDQWVRTRRVWTSHTYHVSNVDSNGNVPLMEDDNWTTPGLNNYRQNVQGEGAFNAPDLTVELAVGVGDCLTGQLQLLATVRNVGSLGVPAGVEVSLFEGADASGALVGTQATPGALLPGQQVLLGWTVDSEPGSEALEYYVLVDGADAQAQADGGAVGECDEENNGATTLTAACPAPG